MNKLLLSTVIVLFQVVSSVAADGTAKVQSSFGVKETGDRLEQVLKEKGMKVFNRIDHSAGAQAVGVDLRDTELLIFGNPKVGAPLMKCQQSVGLDLPMKALIWKAEDGSVFISYNTPAYLKNRHAVSGCDQVLKKVEKALAAFTSAAASP